MAACARVAVVVLLALLAVTHGITVEVVSNDTNTTDAPCGDVLATFEQSSDTVCVTFDDGSSAEYTCIGAESTAASATSELATVYSVNASSFAEANCIGTATLTEDLGEEFSCTSSGIGPEATNYYVVNCTAVNCFSAASTVALDTGEVVPYSSLAVGDRVLSAAADGSTFFDKVFRVPHFEPDKVAQFVVVTTACGRVLELTPDHTLHMGTCCDVATLSPASRVAPGDVVFVAAPGSDRVTPVAVASVARVQRAGVFSAHTLSGNIVVDGVVASHFTAASRWSPAGRRWAPWWYRTVDAVASVTGVVEDAGQPYRDGDRRRL